MSDRYRPRPRPPWQRCTRCGLEAPDVRRFITEGGTIGPFCPDEPRCERVRKLSRPQLELYPPHLQTTVDQRPWEELELGKVER